MVAAGRSPATPAPDRAPILAVRDLDKSFGGLRVLSGVTFDVPAGSITGLVGPNGSGKSTLFDVITGYLRCDGGEITFSGEPIGRLAPHEVSRRGLVRTFQLTRIFPTMTVAENLLVFADQGRRRRGPNSSDSSESPNSSDSSNSSESEDRAGEILDLVGLLRLAGHEAAGLSYGQQKLLEIAQVLMLEPRLLLLDEPMAGINPGLADEIAAQLGALRELGVTLLLVEHNIPIIQRLCDTVAVLGAGSVMAYGEPAAVLGDPEVREAFLGE